MSDSDRRRVERHAPGKESSPRAEPDRRKAERRKQDAKLIAEGRQAWREFANEGRAARGHQQKRRFGWVRRLLGRRDRGGSAAE